MSQDEDLVSNLSIKKEDSVQSNVDMLEEKPLDIQSEFSTEGFCYGEIFINNKTESCVWWVNCVHCQQKFHEIEEFLNHAAKKHFLTDQLDEIFVEKDDLTKFEEYISNDEKDVEESCSESRVTENSDSEAKDIKTDAENKKVSKKVVPKCDTCDKTFKRSDSYRRHMKTHENPKIRNPFYECKICNVKIPKEEKLQWRYHRETAHKEKPKCQYCGRAFKSKTNLNNHIQLHIGSKDFKCDQCSSAFFSKAYLTDHIRKAHKIPKVPCKYCNKSFKAGTNLKIHERIHTGERPYICELCGNSFQTSGLLQKHMKRHFNDRQHECDICGKKFFSQTYLKDHKITHTDEKPFECQVCSAKFNSRPALVKHKQLHSNVKKYVCSICGKAYAQRPGLYAHMKYHNIAAPDPVKN